MLLAKRPELMTGVVLFDVWTLNRDRNASNILRDALTEDAYLLDHEHALFGDDVAAKFDEHAETSGLTRYHAIAARARRLPGIANWLDRILEVPSSFITRTVRECERIGLPSDAADRAVAFLLSRRGRLADIVLRDRGTFPSMGVKGWNEVESQLALHGLPAGVTGATYDDDDLQQERQRSRSREE